MDQWFAVDFFDHKKHLCLNIEYMKSQFVTSRENTFFSGQGGGRRKFPYAFTEQGIYMLATVLKGELATKQSIFIMRAFKEMRHFIANNALMFEKINAIELKQLEYQKDTDEKFGRIFEYMTNHEEENQKIFYDGQIFDAFSFLTDIIGHAKREIVLIDGYIDVITLNILARFLIIDGVEGYHIGASLKDAGKKCFGVNKIEGTDVVKDIMKKAQQTCT